MIAELDPTKQPAGGFSIVNLPKKFDARRLVEITIEGGMWTYLGPPPRLYKLNKKDKKLVRMIGPECESVESQMISLGWTVVDKPSSEDE